MERNAEKKKVLKTNNWEDVRRPCWHCVTCQTVIHAVIVIFGTECRGGNIYAFAIFDPLLQGYGRR